MANLPEIRRILREDLKGFPDYVTELLIPLNKIIGSLYSALDKNINDANLAQQMKSIKFTTGPDGLLVNPLTFNLTLKTQPVSCVKDQCVSTPYLPNTSAVDISWSNGNGFISIDYITGLRPNTTYQLQVTVK